MPHELTVQLASHIGRLEDQSAEAWLFPDADVGTVRATNWRARVWPPALDDAGLGDIRPRLTFHDLRRYHSTQVVAGGVDSRTLMNRMGHTTARMALEHYAQPDPTADRNAAEQASRGVFGAMSHVERTTGLLPGDGVE